MEDLEVQEDLEDQEDVEDLEDQEDLEDREDVGLAGFCDPLPPPHLLPLGHLRIPQASA